MPRLGSAPSRAVVGRAALFALVAEWWNPSIALAAAADFDAGRAVVVGGKDASITPCFMCHGLDGVGIPQARSRG
jgi:cytochrome c553